MCILGCGVLWWITNVSTWLGGCTWASITISFSESWWELIRHLPSPRKAVGLLSKVKDEASGLWTKIWPASSPFDFPLKPGAQKKSFYLVVLMGQMHLLKCVSEITSLNRTIKIIKRKHSFFSPNWVKILFIEETTLLVGVLVSEPLCCRRSKCFRNFSLGSTSRGEGNDASSFWAPAPCKALCQPHPGTLIYLTFSIPRGWEVWLMSSQACL